MRPCASLEKRRATDSDAGSIGAPCSKWCWSRGGRLKSAMILIQTFSGQFAAAAGTSVLPYSNSGFPPLTNVLAGGLIYPAGHIPEILYAFGKFVESASDDMMTVGEVLQSQQGPRFGMQICYCGDPRRENDLLKPLRASLKPQDDNVRVMPYLEANRHSIPHSGCALPNGPVSSATRAGRDCDHYDPAPPLSRVFCSFLRHCHSHRPRKRPSPLRQRGYEIDITGRWSAPSK